MSNRLYGDQLQSSGRRFYFGLDSAPGIITPAPASLSLQGRVPAAAQPATVFRTPAPASLTLSGKAPGAPVVLSPGVASITALGLIASEVRSLTITPTLAPPLENPPPSFAPTIIFIQTKTPAPALLTLTTLEINVTQGGNIGFVSPAPAQLDFRTLPYSLLLLAGGVSPGLLAITGLAPNLRHELTIAPDVARLTTRELTPELSLPFRWVDDDPAPARMWITDAAA
jgi:hypothetical protein